MTTEQAHRTLLDLDRDLRRAISVGYVVIPHGRAGVYLDTLLELDSRAATLKTAIPRRTVTGTRQTIDSR